MCMGGSDSTVTQQAAPLTPEQQEAIALMLDSLRVRNALIEPVLNQLGYSLVMPATPTGALPPTGGTTAPTSLIWPTDPYAMSLGDALATIGSNVNEWNAFMNTSATPDSPFGVEMRSVGYDPANYPNPTDLFTAMQYPSIYAQPDIGGTPGSTGLVQNTSSLYALPPTPQQASLDQLQSTTLASAIAAQQQLDQQAALYPTELSRLLELTRSLQPNGLR